MGIGAVITAFLTGYFGSMGIDFWELTKSGVNASMFLTPFWLVSVPIGVFGIMLLAWGIRLFRRARLDFRHALASEMQTILKDFIGDRIEDNIRLSNWSSKHDRSKSEILGKGDYALLKGFYDKVEERNKYLASRHGFDWTILEGLKRECVDAYSKAFDGIPWLREPSADAKELLLRAKKGAKS